MSSSSVPLADSSSASSPSSSPPATSTSSPSPSPPPSLSFDLNDAQQMNVASLVSMGFPQSDVEFSCLLHPTVDSSMEFLLLDEEKRAEWRKNFDILMQQEAFTYQEAAHSLVSCKNDVEEVKRRRQRRGVPTTGAKKAESLLGLSEILQMDPNEYRAKASTSSSSPSSSPSPSLPGPTSSLSIDHIRSNLLAHRSIFLMDTDTLADLCKRQLCNQVDHHGNTPLSLAHQLGYNQLVTFLLNRGVDPRIKTSRGWSLLQEAALLGRRAECIDIEMHLVLLKQQEWERNLPRLLSTLSEIPDFYMEIEWKVESWIPLVSRLAPSDIFKIWKIKDKLRFDSNVRGMDGMNVIKGLTTLLFNSSSVYLIDHTRQTCSDALSEFRSPSYEKMEHHVDQMLMAPLAIGRQDIDIRKVEIKEKKTLLGYQKTEKIHNYQCKLYEMGGLAFNELKVKGKEKDNNNNNGDELSLDMKEVEKALCSVPDYDEYFNEEKVNIYNEKRRKMEKEKMENSEKEQKEREKNSKDKEGKSNTNESKETSSASSSSSSPSSSSSSSPSPSPSLPLSPPDVIVPLPDSDSKSSDLFSLTRKDVSASLCLSDDFPLRLSSFVSILELLSPASSQLAKLRDLLSVNLPPQSFPVKLVIPVLTQVNAVVTFNKFEKLEGGKLREEDDKDTMEIPKGFRQY